MLSTTSCPWGDVAHMVRRTAYVRDYISPSYFYRYLLQGDMIAHIKYKMWIRMENNSQSVTKISKMFLLFITIKPSWPYELIYIKYACSLAYWNMFVSLFQVKPQTFLIYTDFKENQYLKMVNCSVFYVKYCWNCDIVYIWLIV